MSKMGVVPIGRTIIIIALVTGAVISISIIVIGTHSNLSYSNNNFLQPPAGFNVSKGRVVEPLKKEEKYEQGILKILKVL